MDNLTHSLVGALIGQAGLKRCTGLAMPTLVIGANLPDIDATCVLLGEMQHLALRRGITHGPIAWLLLPLLLAGGLWWFDRWQARRGKRPAGRLEVRFGWLFALAFIACLTHPALDWLNVYGIRLLEPFSHSWFYGDVLFIVDVWLWLGMGFATWLSLRREKRGGEWRRPARIATVAALAYIGTNAAITRSAEQLALPDGQYAETIASPVPFVPWRRELIFRSEAGLHRLAVWRLGGEVDDVRSVTGLPLASCDLNAARAALPVVDNFLFWSRAPFVSRGENGAPVLGDARFAGELARERFTVEVPSAFCAEPALQ